MTKIRRIFDIAKELNISHIEIINFLDKKGVSVTLMSPISNEQYSDILEHFYQEKNQVDRLRKEKARLNVVHHNQEQDKVVEKDDQKSKESTKSKEDSVESAIKEKSKDEVKDKKDEGSDKEKIIPDSNKGVD